MKRFIALMAVCALAFALACSKKETETAAGDVKAAGSAAATAAADVAARTGTAAQNTADAAAQAARQGANAAAATAQNTAASVATSAVDTCRSLAARGAWGSALEACKKAHEMLPDDMALEHAYQQAKAASGGH